MAAVNGEVSQLSSKVLLDVRTIRLAGSQDATDRANMIEKKHVEYGRQYLAAKAGRNPQSDVPARFKGHNDTLTGHKVGKVNWQGQHREVAGG